MARRTLSETTWPVYVPVAERQAKAKTAASALAKKGKVLCPVRIEGRAIATSFWGKAWCTHIESLVDFESRLPRGRTYVRGGSVLHLGIANGRVLAHVQGSKTYDVSVRVSAVQAKEWAALARESAGQIASVVELLRGNIADGVMGIMSRREGGLFPKARDLEMACSCPDWATMCKHVAAVMYGIGARLDTAPELLFLLRGVDPSELVAKVQTIEGTRPARRGARVLEAADVGGIFGIELEEIPAAAPKPRATSKRRASRSE